MVDVSSGNRDPSSLVMKRRAIARGGLLAAFAAIAAVSGATQFQLQHLDLGGGLSLDGTITTDGTVGALNPANILDWSISATQIDEYHYTQANTTNLSADVMTDGTSIYLNTSPDGIADGGRLAFYRNSDFQARVADFSGDFTSGGTSMWSGSGGSGFLPLNQPDNSQYTVATGSNGLFSITQLDFGSGISMAGTIQTDGSIGSAHLTAWDVVVRVSQSWNLNRSNSGVRSMWGVSTDGSNMVLTPFDEFMNGNSFAIGYGTFDPTLAILGDFSVNPQGEAGFVNPLMYQTITPLALNGNGDYLVATAVPEPATLGIIGVPLLGLLRRRRRG